jgi:capsule polysaccharide export protein KpsE/RkpR
VAQSPHGGAVGIVDRNHRRGEWTVNAAMQKGASMKDREDSGEPLWVARSHLLLAHRRLLLRTACVALALNLAFAFLIPKRYTAIARIMPPDSNGSTSSLMLAALSGRAGNLGTLGSLAGGLLGAHSTTALFLDLLRSGTVTDAIIDRFHLQRVYHKRYRVDTAKALARRTSITDDKKSGVITISVEDVDPVRARDLTQAYLDGLNHIVTHTNTSAARQERIFIEHRLQSVVIDLGRAQRKLAEFSSRNSTVDIKEQTRAMVDAGARLQGELLVEQAGLESLRQVYGDGNVRVRSAQARIGSLRHDLEKMVGSSEVSSNGAAGLSLIGGSPASGREEGASADSGLYPPLRQLPRLAVPFADLYRDVRVQETAYELLTQQYEISRLEEAKDVPVVSVIDPPGVPEKKSFPPRLWVSLALTAGVMLLEAAFLILRDEWCRLPVDDPRRTLLRAALQRRDEEDSTVLPAKEVE